MRSKSLSTGLATAGPTAPAVTVGGTGAVIIDAAGTPVLRSAAGTFHHLISSPQSLVEQLRSGTDESWNYLERLRPQIREREVQAAESRWPASRRQVTVIGEGRIVDDLLAGLTALSVTALAAPATTAPSAVDLPSNALVIAVANSWDERMPWPELDELPAPGTAWLRAYREGEVCFVDPISVESADPGSEQVRRRRLAASPAPMYATLRPTVPAPPLDVVSQTLVAARLLTVALAWASNSRTLASYRRTLWKYIPATGSVSEHPVFGFPEPAPSAVPPPTQ